MTLPELGYHKNGASVQLLQQLSWLNHSAGCCPIHADSYHDDICMISHLGDGSAGLGITGGGDGRAAPAAL
jgi:hypothetical protein